jgi:hypothetical protein
MSENEQLPDRSLDHVPVRKLSWLKLEELWRTAHRRVLRYSTAIEDRVQVDGVDFDGKSHAVANDCDGEYIAYAF